MDCCWVVGGTLLVCDFPRGLRNSFAFVHFCQVERPHPGLWLQATESKRGCLGRRGQMAGKTKEPDSGYRAGVGPRTGLVRAFLGLPQYTDAMACGAQMCHSPVTLL